MIGGLSLPQENKTRFMDEWINVPLCCNGETLYHYTAAEGVKGILEDGKFLATKSDFLNDKTEFLYAFDVLKELIATYLVNTELQQTLLQLIHEELVKLSIVAPSYENGDTQNEAMQFYIVSFSKQENSALLWAEFTDFKGYCLGFDYKQLVSGFDKHAFMHGSVLYHKKEQTSCLLEGLLSCIRRSVSEGMTDLNHIFEEENNVSHTSLKELAKDMAMVCSVYAMFFKKEFFSGEEEYRFIFSPENNAEQKFRILGQIFLPYIMVEFYQHRVPLKSVVVGAKNNSDIAVRGMHTFLKSLGYDVPVTNSDIPLRY